MEVTPRPWRHQSVNDIDCLRLTSVLLYLGRILIVFQQFSFFVMPMSPAEQLAGSYRGTSVNQFLSWLYPVYTIKQSSSKHRAIRAHAHVYFECVCSMIARCLLDRVNGVLVEMLKLKYGTCCLGQKPRS